MYHWDEEYLHQRYEIFDLKIIHRRRRTGFEESKDIVLNVNDLVAGRYQVSNVFASTPQRAATLFFTSQTPSLTPCNGQRMLTLLSGTGHRVSGVRSIQSSGSGHRHQDECARLPENHQGLSSTSCVQASSPPRGNPEAPFASCDMSRRCIALSQLMSPLAQMMLRGWPLH